MGYNKKKHLQENILAIETAFKLEQSGVLATAEQVQNLKRYSGFGGLKCILRPCEQAEDIQKWTTSEQDLFTDTAHLYTIIKKHSASEQEYKSYVSSLHSSILSAFYAPSIRSYPTEPIMYLMKIISSYLSKPNSRVEKNFTLPCFMKWHIVRGQQQG